MSRLGKQPVPLPEKVDVDLQERSVRVKGPKGSLEVPLMPGISAEVADGEVVLQRDGDEKQARAFHGLVRALLANAVTGVSTGWSKELEIVGIGYRGEVQGKDAVFNLGYSHPIRYPIPDGIDIAIDGKTNRVTVSGIDRQQVGQVAAEIREMRPPEPYKGKGVRYFGERIRTKAGKQGA